MGKQIKSANRGESGVHLPRPEGQNGNPGLPSIQLCEEEASPMHRGHWVAILCLTFAAMGVPAFADIIDSVNAGGPQGLGPGFQFAVPDVGWYFTPSSSYILNSVYFDFGTTDGRTVT